MIDHPRIPDDYIQDQACRIADLQRELSDTQRQVEFMTKKVEASLASELLNFEESTRQEVEHEAMRLGIIREQIREIEMRYQQQTQNLDRSQLEEQRLLELDFHEKLLHSKTIADNLTSDRDRLRAKYVSEYKEKLNKFESELMNLDLNLETSEAEFAKKSLTFFWKRPNPAGCW